MSDIQSSVRLIPEKWMFSPGFRASPVKLRTNGRVPVDPGGRHLGWSSNHPGSFRSSILALITAMALAVVVYAPTRWFGGVSSQNLNDEDQYKTRAAGDLPDDQPWAERGGSRWKQVAEGIARSDGAEGLRTLDLFGEEAGELFEDNPRSFHELMAISKLDPALLELSTGPWRKAVLEWARAGTLAHYLDHLTKLNVAQRILLKGTPGCLPLLGRGAVVAEAMISRHGERAWRVFLCVDFAEDIPGLERVARALEVHGERMLRVNESHGPALAQMFVAPPNDNSDVVPPLFVQAIDRLGLDEAGALFLANYDDLLRLVVEEGHQADEIIRALDLLAGQTEEVRALASDNARVLRLLLERWRNEPVGFDILARCGPEAAELLYEGGGYAIDDREKAAVLAILARRGWAGIELLHRFRRMDSWHKLIRRPELLDGDAEPLIVRLAGKLENSADRQDQIERYLKMPREQILEEDIPPTVAAQAMEWIPGYLAVHTTYQASRGYHLEKSEVALALFDGVTTATFFGKILGQSIKTIGRQAPRAAFQGLEREVVADLARSSGREVAQKILNHLPGVVLSTTRELPTRLPTLDITSVMRTGSELSRKLGVKTWGKLDRRIIMRRDRIVVIDLSDAKVVKLIRERVKDQALDELRTQAIELLKWKVIGHEVGALAPCLMERVRPGLRNQIEELPPTRVVNSPADQPARIESWSLYWRLRDHPEWRPIGSALIAACLLLALLSARKAFMERVFQRKQAQIQPRRRYEE